VCAPKCKQHDDVRTPGHETVRWIRYEPHEFMLAARTLSAAADLAHRRLADAVWATGIWPVATGAATWREARVTAKRWPSVLVELSAAGWRVHRGKLVNRRVLAVLSEARAALRQSKTAGARGGRLSAAVRREAAATPPGADPRGLREDPGEGGLERPSSDPAPTLERASSDPPARLKTDRDSEEQTSNTMRTDERSTLSSSAQEVSSDREGHFMRSVEETLALFSPEKARLEMANWGGWWRTRYREAPDKARRLLAEIRSMIQERRIRKNPGATAADLWKRLP
jgi:hypothetical protein